MSNRLQKSSIWPPSKLNIALKVLAQKAGLNENAVKIPELPVTGLILDNTLVDQWMAFASNHLKIDIIHVESTYADLEKMLSFAAPSVIRIDAPELSGFMIILKKGKKKLTIIRPDLQQEKISVNNIFNALTCSFAQEATEPVRKILDEVNISEDRRIKAESAIIREQLSEKLIQGVWLLRLSSGTDLKKQILQADISFQSVSIAAAHCIGQLLLILSWWVIAKQSIEGHFERYEMIAWALLLICLIPFRVLDKWFQNLFTMSIGGLFKQRLLCGILQLEPEEVRHQGSGQFLGTIMEAESFGSLAMESGLVAVVATLELFFSFWVLVMGAGGLLFGLSLVFWISVTAKVCLKYYHQAQKWIGDYRDMTNDMVERMVGYRTRIIQENPFHWHDEEAKILENYLNLSKKLDHMGLIIQGVNGEAWILFNLPVILYLLMTQSSDIAAIAITVGGILLAAQAFTQFSIAATRTIQVLAAWEHLKPLFKAADRINNQQISTRFILPFMLDNAATRGDRPLLTAKNLTFSYGKDLPQVLKPFTKQIERNDRILLEGPSGGGKSTLSALMSALRLPDSGELLLWGMDLNTVGKNIWRKRVVIAPQFHENHVLTETFAFNLLMSRAWPPLRKDIEDALEICKALGLGNLLEQMPAGFHQMIGEGGWQLSHGERSRLFIARALLQCADLIILDESFAALDPENMAKCLKYVFERSHALIVVAHP
jgi:ATP-binding cassette subfamily B protein